MANPVMVKFTVATAKHQRLARIAAALGARMANASPLFPDDPDPELGSVIGVVLAEGADVDLAIADLQLIEGVEYAHRPASRGPHR